MSDDSREKIKANLVDRILHEPRNTVVTDLIDSLIRLEQLEINALAALRTNDTVINQTIVNPEPENKTLVYNVEVKNPTPERIEEFLAKVDKNLSTSLTYKDVPRDWQVLSGIRGELSGIRKALQDKNTLLNRDVKYLVALAKVFVINQGVIAGNSHTIAHQLKNAENMIFGQELPDFNLPEESF